MNYPVATAADTLADYFHLPNGNWIIANRQRFWSYRAAPPRSEGEADANPALATVSRQRYLYRLASGYQTTHATPPTMRRFAARFAAMGDMRLAAYCETVADEESGHDELALRDLAALGLNAHDFVAKVRPASALRPVELFQALADGPEPIAVLGYAYALERMALFSTAETLQAVELALPAGVKATRCLRVHSGVGTDVRHVRESQEFIASLPAADRRAIFNALFETVTRMVEPVDYPGDAVMDAWAARFGAETSAEASPVSL